MDPVLQHVSNERRLFVRVVCSSVHLRGYVCCRIGTWAGLPTWISHTNMHVHLHARMTHWRKKPPQLSSGPTFAQQDSRRRRQSFGRSTFRAHTEDDSARPSPENKVKGYVRSTSRNLRWRFVCASVPNEQVICASICGPYVYAVFVPMVAHEITRRMSLWSDRIFCVRDRSSYIWDGRDCIGVRLAAEHDRLRLETFSVRDDKKVDRFEWRMTRKSNWVTFLRTHNR